MDWLCLTTETPFPGGGWASTKADGRARTPLRLPARPCRPFSHKKNPFCLTARPQGAGRDERVSPARAGRNPKGVMPMGDAFEHGTHRARHTTRGRRSEPGALRRADAADSNRIGTCAKTRRATSSAQQLRGES